MVKIYVLLHKNKITILVNCIVNLLIIIEIVENIPLSISPEVCGLNSNALVGYHNSLINYLWADMLKLYPSMETISNTNNDWDEMVQKTTEDILKSLPEIFNLNKVKTFYGDKCCSPNIIVLLNELRQFNLLLEAIQNTLSQLSMVLKLVLLFTHLQ